MPLLWAASIRHLLRHPAQLILALVGLSVGVGTIIAVDIATASAGRAFQLSMQAVNGAATHSIVGGAQGIDEKLYVGLRKRLTTLAPVVEGYVVVGERTMQLVGIDPFASASLDRSGRGVRPARARVVHAAGCRRDGCGDGSAARAAPESDILPGCRGPKLCRGPDRDCCRGPGRL